MAEDTNGYKFELAGLSEELLRLLDLRVQRSLAEGRQEYFRRGTAI